jgi:SpoVK/Ycf46/Vps4 family AAA+-type ATPase
MPVDADSRMALARIYEPGLAHEPVFPESLWKPFAQVIAEHRNTAILEKANLTPVRTLMLVGPPGVGKTMAAHWIATELKRPLVVLDLATTISSFLGKTGQNVRQMFDFGKEFDCVFMLDEVDAIAKRRSDDTDLGELKRLVNVILQELDEWPTGSLLVAATNHPDLLDPAIWRRFDTVINLPLPDVDQRQSFVSRLEPAWSHEYVTTIAQITEEMNYSEIEGYIKRGKKAAVMLQVNELESVMDELRHVVRNLPNSKRQALSTNLLLTGLSQRKVSELTGTSRNTIRKRAEGTAK